MTQVHGEPATVPIEAQFEEAEREMIGIAVEALVPAMRGFCLTFTATALALSCGSAVADSPNLRCQFDTAGEHLERDFGPTADPYTAPTIPIGRHFRFKAVVTARDGQVDWIALYTYYPDDGRTVLLHTARHAAPAITDGRDPFALTGEQRVYSPILERELVFGCALVEGRR